MLPSACHGPQPGEVGCGPKDPELLVCLVDADHVQEANRMPVTKGRKIGCQHKTDKASHETHDEAPREEWTNEVRILGKLGWEGKWQWKPAQKT